MSQPVDTKSCKHRPLRFENIGDCIDEVQRIIEMNQKGTLRSSGNWTPGQIFNHLASWINYAYEGFPVRRPPFFIRWILRWRLRAMLRSAMPRGVWIPGVDGGTCGMEAIDCSVASAKYLKALQRLQSNEDAPYDSPAFGKMSHNDRIQLNLRHAELHLGYLHD